MVWSFGLSGFWPVPFLSLLLRHLDSTLDSMSPARRIRDTSTVKDLRPDHFFFAVLAASRNACAVGAPLLPGLRGLPPRFFLALMLAYRPGFPFGITAPQGYSHSGQIRQNPATASPNLRLAALAAAHLPGLHLVHCAQDQITTAIDPVL